ncbi:GDSL-type esterase/lipase family protein [Proteus mirabilis]
MSTIPTQNPVPSEAPRDLKFNSGKIDEFVTSNNHFYTDRFGEKHYTIDGINYLSKQAILNYGYITKRSFESGNTIINPNDVLLWESNGEYYRWDGELPKVVSATSTPDSAGGVGKGKWVGVGDATLRSSLKDSEGASLVGVKDGGTIQGKLDEIVDELNNPSFIKHTFMEGIKNISARMASGEVIKIACFGDSTTDGDTTTEFIKNPTDASGNAIGNTDHNMTAPNAWPNILQGILREAYGNNNIHVFNAGYSGKKIHDGWAVRNYDKAITNNPYYGKPDITIIDFGLNDIKDGVGILNDYLDQTQILIDKIKEQGTIPILLTSGPCIWSNDDGSQIDNKQISQQINEAKKSIAKKNLIEIINKADALKEVIENNSDNIKWIEIMKDGLHFSDTGHRIQAGFLFSIFYGDIVKYNRGRLDISSFDSRSNSPCGVNWKYSFIGSKFGGYSRVPESYLENSNDLIKLFVYCTSPSASLYYINADNDGQGVIGNNSTINVLAFNKNSIEYNKSPNGVGFNYDANPHRRFADKPDYVCKLNYGLNVVTLKKPSVNTITDPFGCFYGYFSISDSYDANNTNNLLKSNGCIFSSEKISSDRIKIEQPARDIGANSISFIKDKTVSLYLDLTISKGFGLGLMGGVSDLSNSTDNYSVDKCLMLYQIDESRKGLYVYRVNNKGVVAFDKLVEFSVSEDKLLIDFSLKENNIYISVSTWDKKTNHTTFTISSGDVLTIPTSGYFGGLYLNGSAQGDSGSILINKAFTVVSN